MSRVGVVGAGVMGGGVAQNLATAGHEVVLIDVSKEVLDRCAERIRNDLRFSRLLPGAAPTAVDAARAQEAITFTTDYGALADADFVVENITERWDLKARVYPVLDDVCPERTVFAANTSAIPITRIASLTRRPANVLGIHFMNPVPRKPVVELIPGHHTSPQAVGTAQELLASMGKTGIVVNDSPGFVSNRVLMLTINEAAFLVHENVATPEDVDKVFTSCFGHPMGPLATADLIGLDTILYSIEVLHESFADSKYRPCPLLKKMVDAGLHGRKTQQGFFSYALEV
ncbi:3-hydroxyacyl-CoA dehydrogenase family protein [Streptomyces roseirectus]|uniref:3-hydroxyacyl-CoA dehydrogenase family protein n=1 Tax=Streptomyces roseirectus TaxID=2768066 RepID=A0A7H0IN71_9ACTN|nr:3-hydroxyacyl-CoA dehydrogenase family protein [Streptomyces roseirectus]QNP74237.1 3-hydroxyacyl-CoA dehydrogenase family protein [Streptomyces roseirectus]